MSPIFATRPLAVALAAILVAVGGAAHAARPPTRATPRAAPPAAPAMPDVKALVAQAKELRQARRSPTRPRCSRSTTR